MAADVPVLHSWMASGKLHTSPCKTTLLFQLGEGCIPYTRALQVLKDSAPPLLAPIGPCSCAHFLAVFEYAKPVFSVKGPLLASLPQRLFQVERQLAAFCHTASSPCLSPEAFCGPSCSLELPRFCL